MGKYEYDGLARRIKEHVDTQAPASPDGVDTYRHVFYNTSWQALETRESASENAGPETLQPQYQYVWSDRYIDAPVLRDRNTDADGVCDDETLYYLTDANMNVTCLTDAAGDAVERYVWLPKTSSEGERLTEGRALPVWHGLHGREKQSPNVVHCGCQ